MCSPIKPVLLLASLALVTPPSADSFPQGCGMSCFPSCCSQTTRQEVTTELTLARATIYPPGNDCEERDLDAAKAAAEPGDMDTDAAMDMMRSPFAAINAAGRRSKHKKKKNEAVEKESAKESSGDEGKADDAAGEIMRSPFAAINAAGRRSKHKKKKDEGMGKENAKESSGDEGKADDAGEIMRSPFAAINAAGRQKHKKKKDEEQQ